MRGAGSDIWPAKRSPASAPLCQSTRSGNRYTALQPAQVKPAKSEQIVLKANLALQLLQ